MSDTSIPDEVIADYLQRKMAEQPIQFYNPGPQKWEYLVDPDTMPSRLNELGLEGWELVVVRNLLDGETIVSYFKRPLP